MNEPLTASIIKDHMENILQPRKREHDKFMKLLYEPLIKKCRELLKAKQ